MKKVLGIFLVLVIMSWTGDFVWAGSLEPTAPPGPTMKTLQELYDKLVEIEGKISDGGSVAPPFPRFTKHGTTYVMVTDNLTGLIWQSGPCYYGQKGNCICGDYYGGYSDWRVPTRKELLSLIDDRYYGPALSNTAGTGQWTTGNPFNYVYSDAYWSSTAAPLLGVASTPDYWFVDFNTGDVGHAANDSIKKAHCWCVRGGTN